MISAEKAKLVKAIILDVDGVLTEGSICTGEDRELFKPLKSHF